MQSALSRETENLEAGYTSLQLMNLSSVDNSKLKLILYYYTSTTVGVTRAKFRVWDSSTLAITSKEKFMLIVLSIPIHSTVLCYTCVAMSWNEKTKNPEINLETGAH